MVGGEREWGDGVRFFGYRPIVQEDEIDMRGM